MFSVLADTLLAYVNPVPEGERPTLFVSTKEDGNTLGVWVSKSVAATIGKAVQRDRQ